MNFLLEVDSKEIELAIKDKLMVWYEALLDSQYQSMIKALLILLLCLMSVPLIEYFIYKKWVEPKFIKKEFIKSEEFCKK